MEKSVRWRKALTGGVIFLGLGIGGLVVTDVINGPEATRDDATQEIVEAGNEEALSLQVGDCFDELGDEEFAQLPVVPCDESHVNEVFATYTLPAGDWPGDESIQQGSVAECDARFQEFVGVTYDESTLDWRTITPTEDGWNAEDDREVLCVVFDPAGEVTGTLEGAAR